MFLVKHIIGIKHFKNTFTFVKVPYLTLPYFWGGQVVTPAQR